MEKYNDYFQYFDIKPNIGVKQKRGVFNLAKSKIESQDELVEIIVPDPLEVLFVTDFGLSLFYAADPHFLEKERNGRVLDIGFGCGVYPIILNKLGFKNIFAVDINPKALDVALDNIALNRCDLSDINLKIGSLFEPVTGKFDLIISNTSHLPEVTDVSLGKGIDFALLGGDDGRSMLDEVINSFDNYLTEDGRLILVHSSLCGKEKTIKRLNEKYFQVETLAAIERPIPFLAYEGERGVKIKKKLDELKNMGQAHFIEPDTFLIEILIAKRM